MEENNKKEIRYVTSEELDKQFDEKLLEQANVIISAVDSILDKRLKRVRDEMNEKIDGVEARLGDKIDTVQTQIDGYVKAQEDFKDEHVIIKEEVKQMKNAFKDKLGVEISAV